MIIVISNIMLLSSCDDMFEIFGDNFTPSLSAHYLNTTNTSFGDSWSPDAYKEYFKVESFNTSWKFTNVPEWISLYPQSGSTSASVTLSAKENTLATDRTAVFYLNSTESDWHYGKAMSVSQGEAKAYLNVDKSSLTFGGGTSSQTIKISSNCVWTTSNSSSWISTSKNNNELTISVSPNPQSTYRTATLYLRYDNGKSTPISITQSPAGITSSVASLSCDNNASKYELKISAEADWTATGSDSWISVTPDNGKSGESKVSIEIAPNTTTQTRNGYVTFYTNGTTKLQIGITQKGLYIDVPSELEFTSTSSSKSIDIHSNTTWEVISAPNWITMSKTSGKGNDNISITVHDNPNTSSRNGEIVIGQLGLDLETSIKVTQLGKTFSTDMNIIELSDIASTASFNIFSDAKWTSTISDSWFSVTPQNGNGNAEIVVSATENQSLEERTGTILYQYVDKSAYVNVHQLAKYLTISNKSFDFDSKGGSHIIDLSTNDEWTTEIEHQVSWVKLSQTSGKGNASITLTVEDNPSVNIRSTTILIKSKSAQDIRILVSQKPRHLSVNTQSIMFFTKGGNSETFSISTDGIYSISGDANWFTINKESDNNFSIYATNNTSNDFRRGKIKIELTDLVEGSFSLELSVIQAGNGCSFVVSGYTSDVDWNNKLGDSSLSLFISNYTSDINWNDIYEGLLTLTITGYNSDYDWNKFDTTNCNATITGYGGDNNWSGNNKGNGNASISGYGNDNDWNN